MSAVHLHALTETHHCFSGCVSGLPHPMGFVVDRVKPNVLPLLPCARALSEQQDIEVIRGVAAFDRAAQHFRGLGSGSSDTVLSVRGAACP
jgi:hypothetical protein